MVVQNHHKGLYEGKKEAGESEAVAGAMKIHSEKKKFEDATLLTLKVEEEAMGPETKVSPERKKEGKDSSLKPPEGKKEQSPVNTLILDSDLWNFQVANL